MIQLHQLRKKFRQVSVLDGIDLSINAGERIALIGSNGAGKTTLIRCLLGEYEYQGELTFDGMSPRRQRQEVLSRISFVPQLPPPLKMPVRQLIAFSASLCRTTPERINEVAQRLGLDVGTIANRQFVRLSGGMKQKLLIAIALGRDADFIIMDEPAANLDPQARGCFFELLAERAQNSAMLISSHRLDEVASLVSRVIEMDLGKIVLDEKVAEVSGDLSKRLAVDLTLTRADDAAARAFASWQLTSGDGLHWQGEITAVDRLRFLGLTARYSGLIRTLNLG